MAEELYTYQQEAVEFLKRRKGRAGLFMEMGTGKTRVTLVYLRDAGARRILIGCPISAASVWRREIRTKLKLPWHGLNLTKRSILQRTRALQEYGAKMQVVVVNYNVLWMPKEADLSSTKRGVRMRAQAQKRLMDAIDKWQPDSVVLDEAHRIKGRNTRQSRYAASLARKHYVRRRLALTGTPVAQGLEDLFAIYRFIDPSVFGTNWQKFEGHYIKKGGYYGHEIVGYVNEEEAQTKVAETSVVVSKSEALDLPERQDVIVEFDLSPKAQKLYNRFNADFVADIEGLDQEGRRKNGRAIARITLTHLIRLQQLTSGFINTDNGEIKVGTDKLEQALDLIETALGQGQQVVVFCHFHYDIDMLAKALKNKCGIYDGRHKRTRERERVQFQRGKLKVMLVEISAGAESIELTAASLAIYYSLDNSLIHYAQSRDRLHRIGQVNRVTYYLLQARNTIDGKIFEDLGDKQDVAAKVHHLDYARRLATI